MMDKHISVAYQRICGVPDFRVELIITDETMDIDGTGVFWRRTV